MKKERIPMSGGDEWDALSKRSRKFYGWGRGTLKKIKRRYNTVSYTHLRAHET